MMAFILLLLATVLYDGLIGTGEWALLEGALRESLPRSSAPVLRSAGLVAMWLLFLGAYLGICAVMSWVASGRPRPLEVARSFALTLVPIAIGYHVAHYLVFLLVQGQYIIPLLSDPFGRGWNLFGTAGYRVDIALAGARFAWYTAVGAIVTGHVFAVYLAHRRAMAVFEPARVALATQVPLTALMVVYTFIGLSITAEPIVESREAATPAAVGETVAIPAGAILPEAQSGRLLPVGPDRSARAKLTYKVLGSAFHDGTKTSAADILYAYAFAYRWGVRGERGWRALRPLHRCRHGAHAPASHRCAHRRRRCRLQVVPRRRRRFRARDLHRGGLPGRRAGGARMERRHGAAVEHAALDAAGADGGGGRARLGRVLGRGGSAAAASNGSISFAPRSSAPGSPRSQPSSSATAIGRKRCGRT